MTETLEPKPEETTEKTEQTPEGELPVQPETGEAPADAAAEGEAPIQPETSESPAAEEAPVLGEAEGGTPTEPPKPPLFRRVMGFLFNPETRLGRGMRAAVRIAGVTVGLLALGFLAAVLLLWRPSQQSLERTQAQLTDTQAQLSQAQEQAASLETQLTAARADRDQAQSLAARGQTRAQVLKVLYAVTTARMALERRDGQMAHKSLEDAQAQLNESLPSLQALSPADAERIASRLDLARSELPRDPATAATDLEILDRWLLELEAALQ
ncbi:HlyD family secretion protein [Levilinea saccharolytica]|uniref:Uncharacterized protein n=1 Tax=Levilinea saccharolytica TaxID=229921 RepID=A0A0M8JQD5_9CHLR|nr:hypothetical protein [Levilinea saccharolytica]KPL81825.1 hypothetical protein ADN01_09585 [Levilinea saccharolytica]GAP19412.1 hypothetical protein LSAC_03314 [Levilinea saccharolytica]